MWIVVVVTVSISYGKDEFCYSQIRFWFMCLVTFIKSCFFLLSLSSEAFDCLGCCIFMHFLR